MADHHKRFERWRTTAPDITGYLVDQVLSRILPEFEVRGFVWYPDYAGGDATQIGANDIPLQKREGEGWPTVQLLFHKHLPTFSIYFSVLPAVCKRWKRDRYIDIPREIALVFEGPLTFSLCKGRDKTCQYGLNWLPSLVPHRRIEREIDKFLLLLPEVFELFDRGIPNEWLERKFGHVTEHILIEQSREDAFRT